MEPLGFSYTFLLKAISKQDQQNNCFNMSPAPAADAWYQQWCRSVTCPPVLAMHLKQVTNQNPDLSSAGMIPPQGKIFLKLDSVRSSAALLTWSYRFWGCNGSDDDREKAT
jgi:hypothetical protein